MNKKRRGESVLRAGGLEHEEASARAVNAEPWEPMPGMVKRQCPKCRYFFAAPPAAEEPRCRTASGSASDPRPPADAAAGGGGASTPRWSGRIPVPARCR
jgi:hypothetical protein